MVEATLKMSPGKNGTCWDSLVMIIRSSDTVVPIIRFKDRNSALEAQRQLMIALFEEHTGNLTVTIDNCDYDLTYETWQAVAGAVERWYEEYMVLVENVGTVEDMTNYG